MANDSNNSKKIEVEQKFVLTDETNGVVESKLKDLGLVQKGEPVVMVDWYYDLETPTLAPADNWLRYRDTPKGARWELKQGLEEADGAATASNAGTIYAEFAGDDAIQRTIDALSSLAAASTREGGTPLISSSEYEGYIVPKLPDSSIGLIPFARIETTRSSWMYPIEDVSINSSNKKSLAVDLDHTDFGYRVGEVEIVVSDRQDVDTARQDIATFLQQLMVPNNGNQEPSGKLELYLMNRRPDFYDACVQGGSMVSLAK